MNINYEEIKKLLQSQAKFYINPGLDRISALLNLINNPQDKINIIHIAGTNGKGSVSAILANILKCAGYKTGLYTSPHLVEYTERIKINNEDISPDEFSQYLNAICTLADKHNIDMTEFELLSAAAYKYFYDKKTDIAVIETGLGGRLDATNVVKQPVFSVITSISPDHTDRLGNTIEEISLEKAGIIKNNIPVIISKNNTGCKTIKQIAHTKNAPVHTVENNVELLFENDKNYVIYNKNKYEFSLLGTYQKENLALVFQCINILIKSGYKIREEHIINGLKTVYWPARLEYIKEKNILIDGAHNPDGALKLKQNLDFYFKNKKRIFIYSTINTKDYYSIAQNLFDCEDEILYFEFHHKNAVSFEEYTENLPQLKNIKKINKDMLIDFLNTPQFKILTGSLYMIGEVYPYIKN